MAPIWHVRLFAAIRGPDAYPNGEMICPNDRSVSANIRAMTEHKTDSDSTPDTAQEQAAAPVAAGAASGAEKSAPNRRGRSREALLSSLGEVFERMGYDGASLTQLAAATGLGKASLYHHFPGGKAEMAAALLRASVADLERSAFSHLSGKGSSADRLAEFVDGFREYAADGERICLITVFGQGSAGQVHGDTIASQYADWQRRLAGTFEEAGKKPKQAERAAADLLASLYGHLLLARLSGQPGSFRKRARRLKRSLPD